MTLQSKVYIASHRGIVESAIIRTLQQQDQMNFITRTHAELDLTNKAAVRTFFETEKPKQVYLAAAKVDSEDGLTFTYNDIFKNIVVENND